MELESMGSAQALQEEAFEGPIVRCTVKWFNLQKGYGFLEPCDGSADIFMHFSVLEQWGCYHVCPADEVVCETGIGKRGVQATKIHSITSVAQPEEEGAPAAFSLASPFMLEERTGVVKWFNVLKGYGFIEPEDGGRDIFIHTAILRRIGIDRLPPGKRVRVKVFATERGREAREVHLEPDRDA
jgi:CspA family cold shock protein